MDIQQLKQRYDIIGNDPHLLLALNKAIQVAPTDLSILITGESGVGKDVFSRIIHENSLRKHVRQGHGLISVNCGAIPEGTIESELFGHVKGAFTGADKNRKGYFEEANGGTIFLDEIGELPLAMQVKLLRVLENGEIIPVGSSNAMKIDVRIVAATNIDIAAAARQGRFREDLYYRLNQISIYIPPLRERRDDIPLLFRKFSSDVAEKYHMPPIVLTEPARRLLTEYPWYGNVRELKNITEQIAVVETERTITPEILQNYLPFVPTERMPALIADSTPTTNPQITDRELLLKALSMGLMINEMRQEINDLRQMIADLKPSANRWPATRQSLPEQQTPLPSTTYSTHQPPDELLTPEIIEDEKLALEEREKDAIALALKLRNGNRKLAAADLHISERTLYRKLKEYNIE
ncbi:MAG: sigma-54-dependent Fis family transcriptional regulator [Bacteroidales bacterium]|nr:sigma-54-dependent Fis family transcriptional regulator [Bacteroidales bacterium]